MDTIAYYVTILLICAMWFFIGWFSSLNKLKRDIKNGAFSVDLKVTENGIRRSCVVTSITIDGEKIKIGKP
jgi:hypothetical protein